VEVGAESYYKKKVLEVCSKFEEVTIALLREHAPGAYEYFAKHDFTWLRSRIVYERDLMKQRQYDEELLKKLQCAAEHIKSTGGNKKRRLTKGYIVTVAGFGYDFLAYTAEKTPFTKAFLESTVESKEDWLRRRISMIWQNQKQKGKLLSLTDIRREMSLKPNTYVKYKIFIEELIDELNNKNL
jgi:hypothetical protein